MKLLNASHDDVKRKTFLKMIEECVWKAINKLVSLLVCNVRRHSHISPSFTLIIANIINRVEVKTKCCHEEFRQYDFSILKMSRSRMDERMKYDSANHFASASCALIDIWLLLAFNYAKLKFYTLFLYFIIFLCVSSCAPRLISIIIIEYMSFLMWYSITCIFL